VSDGVSPSPKGARGGAEPARPPLNPPLVAAAHDPTPVSATTRVHVSYPSLPTWPTGWVQKVSHFRIFI